MTTEAAASLYLAQHQAAVLDRDYAIFNPGGAPIGDLPVIYGFNNGGPHNFLSAVLVADDGEFLGSHCCSSEGYMPHDLGILEGSRPDRHEQFRAKYPAGYRMEFVSTTDLAAHAGLNGALAKHDARRIASTAA